MKLRYFLAVIACIGIGTAYSQTLLTQYQPGPRLIDGTQLNLMVNQVNALTGKSGSPGAIVASTLTANAIVSGDASLGVTGLAAAQGGAVAIVGGTSSTSGNAGGAITGVGGTPGATGVGGAVNLTGGIGGATSGTGGAFLGKGGAGIAGNAVGGASSVVGGAGQGSAAGGAALATGGAGGATGAGGAITITSGAGGATSGAAGAINIAVGAVVSGNGAAVTISAGDGAGGTNAGGDVNLVPGDAVSTGAPGTVKINGNANIMCSSYVMNTTPAATDAVFYIATRPLLVVSISQVHSVAAGGASTLQVTKDSTTAAPGAGTDLLTAAFNLNATANTVQVGSVTTVVADKTMAAGDRLAVDYADAVQASVGVVITACMAPL